MLTDHCRLIIVEFYIVASINYRFSLALTIERMIIDGCCAKRLVPT